MGRILDALDRTGIADNTMVIFTSDNGGDFYDNASYPGPWRGTYFTELEGSLRVPFIMRWPGHIPPGRVSNEIVHEMDLLPTFATVAGGKLPDDRLIGGVGQLDFFTGKQEKSNRDTVMVYVADQIYAVKWRNWKVAFKNLDAGYGTPVDHFQTPAIYDLDNDPREEKLISLSGFQQNGWVGDPVMQALAAHLKTLKGEPPIHEGTPDPYVPEKDVGEARDVGVKENQGSAN